jgi:hypothetical protein
VGRAEQLAQLRGSVVGRPHVYSAGGEPLLTVSDGVAVIIGEFWFVECVVCLINGAPASAGDCPKVEAVVGDEAASW